MSKNAWKSFLIFDYKVTIFILFSKKKHKKIFIEIFVLIFENIIENLTIYY